MFIDRTDKMILVQIDVWLLRRKQVAFFQQGEKQRQIPQNLVLWEEVIFRIQRLWGGNIWWLGTVKNSREIQQKVMYKWISVSLASCLQLTL